MQTVSPLAIKKNFTGLKLRKWLIKMEEKLEKLEKRIKQLELKIKQINEPEFDLEKLWHLHHFNPESKKTHQTKIIE